MFYYVTPKDWTILTFIYKSFYNYCYLCEIYLIGRLYLFWIQNIEQLSINMCKIWELSCEDVTINCVDKLEKTEFKARWFIIRSEIRGGSDEWEEN